MGILPLAIMIFAATTAGERATIEERAESLLKQMTLDEKIDYIGGYHSFYIRAIKRLGLPELKMSDGPLGVRNYGPSTAYAAGIGLAASWDVDLAHRMGVMLGRDCRARGVHFLLGPGVNIYRVPVGGRNFEYLGEDPFLTSRIALAYIQGVQEQQVSATIKHFIANNSELDRHRSSSEIDERTLREIYLPAFEAAVHEAKVGAIMDAYNLVNGQHMTQNEHLNTQVVKREWGFDGIVMSDWDATYDAVAAANAGLDLEMPSGKLMNRTNLLPAIKQGRVTEATIDDKVRRILRTAIRFGWLDREQADASWPRFSQEGRALALESAQSSMVLLKNRGDLLPLNKAKIKSVAVIGPDAYPAVPVGGGSAQVRPFMAVSFLQGISDYLSGGATVTWSPGLVALKEIFDTSGFSTAASSGQPGLKAEYFNNPGLAGTPAVTRVDAVVDFDWNVQNPWPAGDNQEFSARWTGYYIPSNSGDYRFSGVGWGLDEYRVFIDGKRIIDRVQHAQPILHVTLALEGGRPYSVRLEYQHTDHHARFGFGVRQVADLIEPNAKALAAQADVAVVLAGFDPTTESEGYDRTFQLPAGQDELIHLVRDANKNTIVAITSGGGVDMTQWVDGVRAIVQTWYAGQEGGRALAQLLFGEFSPSGKLPATFERHFEDDAAYHHYFPGPDKKIVYAEGVFIGYRHFDEKGIQPLFPFGHGLSYTKFKLSNLSVTPNTTSSEEPAVTVAFDVTNAGKREGAEVAQLYVGAGQAPVPRPPKELKGFAKVKLKPGETKHIQLPLGQRAFSYYDISAKQWRATPGEYDLLVGSSSRQIELRGKVTLK